MPSVSYDLLQQYRIKDAHLVTKTYTDQEECEESCGMFFFPFDLLPREQQIQLQFHGYVNTALEPCLMRDKHIAYLIKGLAQLSSGFVSLDASRPWICYWILHALELLDALPSSTSENPHLRLDQESIDRTIATLKRFWHDAGGFGGGPMQLGHTATSYATALTLALIGTDQALQAIDRQQLYRFFMSRKHALGAFTAHDGGEVDVRVTYCVISIASLYGLLTPALTQGVVEYVVSCQTYEGGFGGEPGNEAHGGYAYCAVATLWILQALDQMNDFSGLLYWLSNRQMPFEGGYQGRTNKLVDGCYSFWQGAIAALLYDYMQQQDEYGGVQAIYPCHRLQLQQYILLCGQQIEGGLRDKPGKPRDHYHSCYCLSGLSIAQHGFHMNDPPVVYGDQRNQVIATHPAYNIGIEKVKRVQAYYEAQGSFVPE